MPRTADQRLQGRILRAAQKLWRDHGEKGVTLRRVAGAAGTTTTTVYKRFRNRATLLSAVAEQVHARLTMDLTSATSLEEVYRRHLHFAERHPREYQLLFGAVWTDIFGPGRDRPVQTWFLKQLAERLGGKPQDYIHAHVAFFLATHGAASMITAAPSHRASIAVRDSCIAVCDILAKNVDIFRRKPDTEGA